MRKFIIEFTCLIFRDEVEIEAANEADARAAFNVEFPSIEDGNGRIVSVRLKGEKKQGSFQQRLEAARRKE